MKKYVKKPIEVEAVQFDGSNAAGIIEFTGGQARENTEGSAVIIPTPEGEMTANPTDWIIKGIAGEFYPCRNEIFEATYSEVTQDSEQAEAPPASEEAAPPATENSADAGTSSEG